MIVTNVESGWEVIFQPAHGLLAGRLADDLAESLHGEYWFETKAAITAHDDFKDEFVPDSGAYVTDVGAPRDFTLVDMDDGQRFKESSRRLQNAYRKHRWIGLLTSRHIDFLYGDASVSKPLEELIAKEQRERRSHLRKLGVKKADLDHAYSVMRWCDRCSLILCRGRLPAMQRWLEITSIGKTRYDISQSDRGTVTVSPWPFTSDSFEVDVEVFCLSQLRFDDDETLGEALSDCEPEKRIWKFAK